MDNVNELQAGLAESDLEAHLALLKQVCGESRVVGGVVLLQSVLPASEPKQLRWEGSKDSVFHGLEKWQQRSFGEDADQ